MVKKYFPLCCDKHLSDLKYFQKVSKVSSFIKYIYPHSDLRYHHLSAEVKTFRDTL